MHESMPLSLSFGLHPTRLHPVRETIDPKASTAPEPLNSSLGNIPVAFYSRELDFDGRRRRCGRDLCSPLPHVCML